MGSIRTRKENGLLMFDFRFQGRRCREQTMLNDSAENRRKMQQVLKKIEAEIITGTFNYSSYFPNSPTAKQIAANIQKSIIEKPVSDTPLFKDFSDEWFDENIVRWKRSYRLTQKINLDCHLVPAFGDKNVSQITKADILKFRATLGKKTNGTKTGLSPDRINHILTPLRMIMEEAATRYNFSTPFVGIKQLRVPKADVDPLSFDEVTTFLKNVRPDYYNYYLVRFYTGLRTAEIDGLKWRHVDFERREINIRETIVYGQEDTAKTVDSQRTVHMSQIVHDALKIQLNVTGHYGKYVFCNRLGKALHYHNVNTRIWYPTLKRLGMRRRRAYQTRHTTATLWLAAGENPEWIARQMGHTSTRMLFTVYSRFVPNLVRQDGSAFDKLLMSKQQEGASHENC